MALQHKRGRAFRQRNRRGINEKPRHVAGLPFVVLQGVSGSGPAVRPGGPAGHLAAAGRASARHLAADRPVAGHLAAVGPASGLGFDSDFDSFRIPPTLLALAHEDYLRHSPANKTTSRELFRSDCNGMREPHVPSRVPFPTYQEGATVMGRYLLLWLLGIPLPILVLIWIFGGLH